MSSKTIRKNSNANCKASTRRLFPPAQIAETTDKGHGRIETRTIQVSASLRLNTPFPFIVQSFRVTRKRTDLQGNHPSLEVVYGITSLSPKDASPHKLLHLLRGHWSIENSSHWVRDETFQEDRSRIRTSSAPRVMATLRNLVIAIIRFLGFQLITDGLRKLSWSRPREVIALLGLGKAI